MRARAGMPAWGGIAPPVYPLPDVMPAQYSADQELEALKNQAGYFENALEEIKNRITELQTGKDKE